MASTILLIESVMDVILVVLPLIIFMIFLYYLNSFVPGEAKKIFTFLTIFIGIYFLAVLTIEGLEVLHFLKIHKGPLVEEVEEPLDLIAHILQLIGLGILFYIAILFRSFAKRLESVKKQNY